MAGGDVRDFWLEQLLSRDQPGVSVDQAQGYYVVTIVKEQNLPAPVTGQGSVTVALHANTARGMNLLVEEKCEARRQGARGGGGVSLQMTASRSLIGLHARLCLEGWRAAGGGHLSGEVRQVAGRGAPRRTPLPPSSAAALLR